tara:strand:+ start:77 stop:334 length:258 start_codon:yes stop_codon:yes gene_type:complete
MTLAANVTAAIAPILNIVAGTHVIEAPTADTKFAIEVWSFDAGAIVVRNLRRREATTIQNHLRSRIKAAGLHKGLRRAIVTVFPQ